jgi:hypothetical protein
MLRVGKVGNRIYTHMYTRYSILGLMSFSKLNLFKISSQSNIWNTLNVINILSMY